MFSKAIQNYTLTLNFVKTKIINILKHIGLKSQTNYDDKKSFKKNLHILEDDASGVQVVISNKCPSKICLKYDKFTLN